MRTSAPRPFRKWRKRFSAACTRDLGIASRVEREVHDAVVQRDELEVRQRRLPPCSFLPRQVQTPEIAIATGRR